MASAYVWKGRVSLPLLRAHLCTLGVSLSLQAWWAVPATAFRHGGLAAGLALTAAAVSIAAPVALMHLALGQLCQRGVVGMWRAVPFFTGVGYLRLLITSLSSVYTIIHLALILTNFFYTLNTDASFRECAELIVSEETNDNETSVVHSSVMCYTENMMAEVTDEPGYYTGVALLTVSLWIVMPFLLYNPVKFMKRVLYVLGPLVLVLSVVIMCCVGAWSGLAGLHQRGDWRALLSRDLWLGAVAQALCSTQVAGGFLVSAGDAIYSNTNVIWTAVILVGANIAASWLGLLFWFSVGGSGPKDTDALAIINLVYRLADEKQLHRAWPLLIFFMLALSAVISMVIGLYPVYERLLVAWGSRWRVAAAATSALGAALALGALGARAAGLRALTPLHAAALPLLVLTATVLEVAAFLFIYGWKVLVEDIEFLTGSRLSRLWVVGWCVSLGVAAPAAAWRVAAVAGAAGEGGWEAEAAAPLAAAGLALLVLALAAARAVARQLHYDCFSKLKSSFAPSRHWGPRDPITHYYWVMRREQSQRGEPAASRAAARARYRSRVAAAPTSAAPAHAARPDRATAAAGGRSYSDDWLYTFFRKQFVKESSIQKSNKFKRSKSLDWDLNKNHSIHEVKKDLNVIENFHKEMENSTISIIS